MTNAYINNSFGQFLHGILYTKLAFWNVFSYVSVAKAIFKDALAIEFPDHPIDSPRMGAT